MIEYKAQLSDSVDGRTVVRLQAAIYLICEGIREGNLKAS